MQSAYRRYYSTQTGLLKYTSNIYEAFDDHQSTLLVSLDQSAAFDCVDHTMLLSFGITDSALDWIRSYLYSRHSFVKFGQSDSAISAIEVGVPQGSSPGPMLFTLYIAPLSAIIRQFDLNHQQYADDTQVYIAVNKTNVVYKLSELEYCLSAVTCGYSITHVV